MSRRVRPLPAHRNSVPTRPRKAWSSGAHPRPSQCTRRPELRTAKASQVSTDTISGMGVRRAKDQGMQGTERDGQIVAKAATTAQQVGVLDPPYRVTSVVLPLCGATPRQGTAVVPESSPPEC